LALKAIASRGGREADLTVTPTTVAAAATVPASSTVKSAACLTKAIFSGTAVVMWEKSAAVAEGSRHAQLLQSIGQLGLGVQVEARQAEDYRPLGERPRAIRARPLPSRRFWREPSRCPTGSTTSSESVEERYGNATAL
jgi:hypothetical protein